MTDEDCDAIGAAVCVILCVGSPKAREHLRSAVHDIIAEISEHDFTSLLEAMQETHGATVVAQFTSVVQQWVEDERKTAR